MADYKEYPEYKDSGIGWMGEIPTDWSRRNLGSLAQWINGFAFKPHHLEGQKYKVVRIKQLLNEEQPMDSTDLVIPEKYFLQNGDLVYSWSMTLATHMWNRGEALLNQHLYRVIPGQSTCSSWLRYSLDAAYSELVNLMHGSAAKHITKKNLLSFQIPLPPLGTQQRLVQFLDAETAHIDAGIANMESLIALLAEKRAALISEVVTRGIPGEHTEFKDSGVEWLGEIPAGWELCRLGYYFAEKSTRLNGGTKVPLLSVTQSKGIVRRDTITDKEPRAEDLNNYKICELGDVVLSRFNAYRGALGVSKEKGIVSPDYMVVRPANYTSPLFLEYLLKSNYLGNSMKLTMGGIGSSDPDASGFSRISSHDLMRFKVPKLPIESQERIVDFIEIETQNIDLLLGEANKAIQLLKEKRQTLISDVVTGKIDVRNSAN